MSTSTVKYLGDLRTESMHIQSGSSIITDAPIDNHGKGEAFSPTDMVANSLATCMLTVVGIKAKSLNLDFTGATANVTKIMGTDPRRIVKIIVELNMGINASEKSKTILERTAQTCPVLESLHPSIEKDITFNWM